MTTNSLIHLSAPGTYQRTIEGLTAKYPNLANDDYKRWSKPREFASVPRLACFQFFTDPNAPRAPITTVFNGLAELKLFLSQPSNTKTSSTPVRRTFLMEGLHPPYVAELGQYLKVDPRVWLRHQRVAIWEKTIPNAGNSPRLPSVLAKEGSFCLDYCQLMHLNLKSQDFTLRCAENERHIGSSRQDSVNPRKVGGAAISGREFDGVGMVHRKASFWSQKLDHDGWTALIIVDEQLKRMLAGTHRNWCVADNVTSPEPFQGGYQDFIPFDSLDKVIKTSGPPRTSPFDDLRYYFEKHSDLLKLSERPESCTVFMLKLVASEYVLLTQYIYTLSSHLAWLLSRRQTFLDFQINWIEECWSDLVALQRRIDDHRRNVAAIGWSLRSSKVWEASEGWTNPIPDFNFIEDQLLRMKEKSESLVAVFSGLEGIVASRRSLLEARGASALAFVGTVFVPMSLIASILSLPNNYSPGAPRFYRYWAISLPLVCLICAGLLWYLRRHMGLT